MFDSGCCSKLSSHQIETARLFLRPFRGDDLHDLHRLWTNAEVRRYLWDDLRVTRAQVLGEIAKSVECFETCGFGLWTLRDKSLELLLGFCGLRRFGQAQDVEILYGIAPQHWGQGLATEAARAVLHFGFQYCNLPAIYAGADPPNSASLRVMEKLGMEFADCQRINKLEAIYYSIARDKFFNTADAALP